MPALREGGEMRRWLYVATLLALASAGVRLYGARNHAAIINTRHDFRAASSASVRAVSGADACVFCHTPHDAGGPTGDGTYLWNHRLSTTQFQAYSSTTLQSTVSPITPQDSSKLCLSCHDGTIALGDTLNDGLLGFVQGGSYSLPLSSSSDLADTQGFANDHPFAFSPQLSSEIRTPPPGDAVRLSAGKVQCISCHDPHQENLDATVGKFLVKSNSGSAICQTCHQQTGWTTSAHAQPPDPSEDPKYTSLQGAHTGYTGVSRNGCESCHRPHAPQVAERLVKFPEENTCFQCHDGSVTNLNIKAEFVKTYQHPVMITPSVHDASESPNSALHALPETSSAVARHAECADCHNGHAANNSSAQPPQVSGPLLGVPGQSAANSYLPRSNSEYEICFKCHGDSANKPQLFDSGTAGIGYGRNPQRQYDLGNLNRYNTRMEFEYSPSYHPVTRARNLSSGSGGEVPSLRPAPILPGGATMAGRTLSPGSLIYCTDCHNNDTGRNVGLAASPEGPHGSSIPHLLERQNMLEPPPAVPGGSTAGVAYSNTDYALCDKCHDVQNSVLRDLSFNKHSEHVQQAGASCSTCHDPHASSSPMLINFDRSIVGPASNGALQYTRTGVGHGTCSLSCHGQDHVNVAY